MSDTPSWVGGADVRAARPARRPVPARLAAAAVLTAGLAIVETVHIVGRDELVPALRGFLVLVVALQVVLAVATARRNAGAALGLLVYQVTTVLAAVAGGFGDERPLLAVGAVIVVVLVSSSLSAFPTIELPPLRPIDRGNEP